MGSSVGAGVLFLKWGDFLGKFEIVKGAGIYQIWGSWGYHVYFAKAFFL